MRWSHGVTDATATEANHAKRPVPTHPPPPVTPSPPLAIWAQLPTERRRRLQRLLAELLARPVTISADAAREGHHDHPRP